jgi:hypothetical protein
MQVLSCVGAVKLLSVVLQGTSDRVCVPVFWPACNNSDKGVLTLDWYCCNPFLSCELTCVVAIFFSNNSA